MPGCCASGCTLVAGGAFTVPGSSGANAIAAWNGTVWLPIGSSFALGVMPAIGFVAFVSGFTQLALPLNVLWSQAGAGCLGHASADAIEIALPTGGVASSRLVVPNNPTLVGVTVQHYALVFEGGAAGSLVAVTSSNGLLPTVGHF